MGFLAGLFGTKKATETVLNIAEKTTDGVVKGIDALFFTEEEKSRASQKAVETYIELNKTIASENTVRSITRRRLAVMIVGTFLFLLVAGAFIHKLDSEWALHILACAKQLVFLVSSIGILYFGPYQIGKMFDKK